MSAPSGAGKTTVKMHLLETIPNLAFSVSATTRERREGEVHGRDYYYIETEEFKERIANNDFVEWEEVYPGTFYGTLQSELDRLWQEGKQVIFDVDVMGGLNLKKLYPDNSLDIFIKPPSLVVLEERLKGRGTEPEEKIKVRLEKAELELRYEDEFGCVVVNDDLQTTLTKITELVKEFLKK